MSANQLWPRTTNLESGLAHGMKFAVSYNGALPVLSSRVCVAGFDATCMGLCESKGLGCGCLFRDDTRALNAAIILRRRTGILMRIAVYSGARGSAGRDVRRG